MISRALLRLRSRIINNLLAFRTLSSSTAGSAVYRDARKYGRPSTVTWSMRLHNSVSLIGTVKYPLKQYATKDGSIGVFTNLLVKPSPDSFSSSFWITLEMWDELAERALLHLKPDDHIYISGELGSYTTVLDGIENTRYKVTAKELNYVRLNEPGKSVMNSRKGTGEYLGKSSLQNYNNRLHLWQIFFASPHEWYDLRKRKKNPKQPDFKHKTTGEALWLRESDPPWVQKQVELLDFRLPGPMNDPTTKSLYVWLSDEQLREPNATSSTKD